MKTVLIAGGCGLIGKHLQKRLTAKGYKVYSLTRRAKARGQIYWDPQKQTFESKHLDEVNVIINLAGANIGEQRWSEQRKIELHESRIQATNFLFLLTKHMPNLEYYVGASGVNCYETDGSIHKEEDVFGKDFLSQLVKDWEQASFSFQQKCKVAVLRTAVVLTSNGGSMDKMLGPIKWGIGSALGNGKQHMPWIHLEDICNMYIFAIENKLEGAYNAVADNTPNKVFMQQLAKTVKRPFFFPAVPAFVLKMALGEMSWLVLSDLQASNEKIKNAGFEFAFPNLEDALKNLLVD